MEFTSAASPMLNNGKTTELYFNFGLEEARMQFQEIFQIEQYKKGLIKRDMVIVDIGAAMGLTSLYFKDYAKMIYACEPNKAVYESAVKNTEKYNNIKVFNIGISGTTREGILNGYDNKQAATYQARDNITSTEKVQFQAIDEFLASNNIDHVDLLKIDCEGMEYEIFVSENFEKIASKIDYIIGESHWIPPTYPEYIPALLKENGFKTEWLPYENMIETVTFSLPGGKKKTYSVPIRSLFFSQKA